MGLVILPAGDPEKFIRIKPEGLRVNTNRIREMAGNIIGQELKHLRHSE